jgi:hypothetical protein
MARGSGSLIRDRDYRTLALVRAELRALAHFTEQVTGGASLTPQHQILLALRASDGRALASPAWPTVWPRAAWSSGCKQGATAVEFICG